MIPRDYLGTLAEAAVIRQFYSGTVPAALMYTDLFFVRAAAREECVKDPQHFSKHFVQGAHSLSSNEGFSILEM